MLSEGKRRTLDLFHQVRERRAVRTLRQADPYVPSLSCPFVETKQQCIAILCFLESGEHDVVAFDADKRMLRGQAAAMRLDLECSQRVVEFIAVTDGESLFPIAGMRIQGITELVTAAVGVGIGPCGRTQKRKTEYIALGVVSIL